MPFLYALCKLHGRCWCLRGEMGWRNGVTSFQHGRGMVILPLGSASPPAAGLVRSAASKLSSSLEKGHVSFQPEITRISLWFQQSVLKHSLKRNTWLWCCLPCKTAPLPSSFPCITLPQPFIQVYKHKMMPKFIPHWVELSSFHGRICAEKRVLHKHARKPVDYLGWLLLPVVFSRDSRKAESFS